MYKEAISDINTTIQLDPQNATAYHNRSVIYTYLKNPIDSETDRLKAAELGYKSESK